jgi:predicted phage-related endonuclease
MGFSRFSNAYDVWLEKTGRVERRDKTEDYIRAGNLLEGAVITYCANHLNEDIVTDDKELERPVPDSPIVVHTDGLIKRTGAPVEGKTEGLYGPIIEPWGEPGTDEVPEYTCIQGQCHLMATDREICHVPTFLGGRGFGYFFVKRNEKLVALIREQAIRFWEDHVLKDIPPEDCAPSLEMAKRIRHIEGDPVALDDELVQQWLDAKQAATDAEKVKKFHQAQILAALDGAEMGKCFLGDVTNFEQNRRGYEVKPSSFRVLRLKKVKK